MFTDHETEIDFLGAFLDNGARFAQWGGLVSPDLFADPAHREFARAFADMKDHDHTPGESTLRAWFQNQGMDWQDHAATFETLRMSVYVADAEIPTLAGQLDDLRRAREARELLARVHGDAGLTITAPEYLSTITRAGDIARITSGATARPDTMGDIGRRVLATLHTRNESGARLVGLPTGLSRLDERAGGLRPREIAIIAARPGVGKTSLALQVGDHNVRAGRRVLFISLEMGAEQLFTRLLAQRTGIAGDRIESARLDRAQWKYTTDTSEHLARSGWILDDAPNRSAPEICAAIYARHAESPLDLVVLDYIQLVAHDPKEQRHRAIGRAVLELRAAAKILDIPIVVISQLNRTAIERPRLSDLRESGDLENHAALVLLLHRPALNDGDSAPEETELIIAKNRFGPCGKITASMNTATTKIMESRRASA